jgi:spore coat protein H
MGSEPDPASPRPRPMRRRGRSGETEPPTRHRGPRCRPVVSPRARFLLVLALGLVVGCRETPTETHGDVPAPEVYNPDWTQATHGRTTPHYGVVFPQTSVNTLEIRMTAAQWAGIVTNMRALLGFEFGDRRVPFGVFPTGDPDYVDVTVTFNGKRWRNVGFRLKGNSSLAAAWRLGSYKLPFRLHFDRYEELYPPIRNQRFYGFQELTFAPGYGDNSLLREKIAADVFRMAGVPAAATAFYRVYIDFGAGPRYSGLYTMVEAVDDTMIQDQFGESSGTVYKPTSRFDSFVEAQFERKNDTPATFTDVRALVERLNSSQRQSNPAVWRAHLEQVLDVEHFLRWLATNTALVNWDTYGAVAHNVYLYGHSTRGLVWIPWDLSESMHGSPGITGVSGPGLGGGLLRVGMSLTLNEIPASWPLIRFLIEDPVYAERYRSHLRSVRATVFEGSSLEEMVDRYHALISPHVVGPGGEVPGNTFLPSPGAFVASPDALKTHVRNRRALLSQFLP